MSAQVSLRLLLARRLLLTARSSSPSIPLAPRSSRLASFFFPRSSFAPRASFFSVRFSLVARSSPFLVPRSSPLAHRSLLAPHSSLLSFSVGWPWQRWAGGWLTRQTNLDSGPSRGWIMIQKNDDYFLRTSQMTTSS